MRFQTPFRIRPAQPADVSALAEVYRESAAIHRSFAPSLYRVPHVHAVAEEFARTLQSSTTVIFVADIDEEIAGYVQIRVLPLAGESSMIRPHKSAEVGLAVRAPFRRQGVGTALMQAAQAWAVEQAMERLVLDCHAANAAAIHLYEGLGYQVLGYFMAKSLQHAATDPAA